MTVAAVDKAGVPYPWSGKEFRGESSKKVHAEHAAARMFLADPDVQHTAANLDASWGKDGSELRRRAHNMRRRKQEAYKAAQRR